MAADMLSRPLIRPEGVAREVQAVENEFRQLETNDAQRAEQAFLELCRPGHVVRGFGAGNLLSLAGAEHAQALLAMADGGKPTAEQLAAHATPLV